MQRIIVPINTTYGMAYIEFQIVKEYPNNTYLVYAQDRICVIRETSNGVWALSKSIDVLDIIATDSFFN
jgi:hypothetical protein